MSNLNNYSFYSFAFEYLLRPSKYYEKSSETYQLCGKTPGIPFIEHIAYLSYFVDIYSPTLTLDK